MLFKKTLFCALVSLMLLGAGSTNNGTESEINDYFEKTNVVSTLKEKKNVDESENEEFSYEYNLFESLSISPNSNFMSKTAGLSEISTVIDFNYCKRNKIDDDDFVISNFRRDENGKYPDVLLPTYTQNHKNRQTEGNLVTNFSAYGARSPRKPWYIGDNYETYASYIRPGDIVWDTVSFVDFDFGDFFTHIAMVVNVEKRGYIYKNEETNQSIREDFYYIETIEAMPSGVRFGVLDDERILKYGTKLIRPKYATTEEIEAAVDFMYSQLGKPYKLDVLEGTYNVPDGNRSTWYCSQLVFSAYENANYNITYRHDYTYPGENNKIAGPILGDQIGISSNVMVADFQYDEFVQMDVLDETSVKIRNTTSNPVVISCSTSKHHWNTVLYDYESIGCRTFALNTGESRTTSISGSWKDHGNMMCYHLKDGYLYFSTARERDGRIINMFFRVWYGPTKNIFKIGALPSGGYKLQIHIPYNSTTKRIKYVDGLLDSNSANNWAIPSGVNVNEYSNMKDNTSYYFDIRDTGNTYLAIADFSDSSASQLLTTIIKINKSKETYTISTKYLSRDAFFPWNDSYFASLKVIGKSGTTWTIRVTNNSPYTVRMKYNKKMCFVGDAKNFTVSNVSDLLLLSRNQSIDVKISENFFADYITVFVSVSTDAKKFITYANKLNNSKKTLTEYHNTRFE